MADRLDLRGIGAAAGAAVGPTVVIDRPEIEIPEVDDPAEAFRSATEAVARDLKDLAASARQRDREEAAEVLEAQALMAEDPMLTSTVETKLAELGTDLDPAAGSEPGTFGAAIDAAATELAEMLRGLDDPYLAARAADVEEVVERVRFHLAGIAPSDLATLDEPAVFVATSLTAAETAQMDPATVLGFVTETGGPTSHVVIIARSLGVPAVVGVGDHAGDLVGAVTDGDLVGLDGATGEIVVRPDEAGVADFTGRAERHRQAIEAAAAWRGKAVSFGDAPVTVAANVANAADLQRAVEEGADGIGLLRTEFLYLDRPAPPGEDEQYEFYAEAVGAFDAPVVIRTFDIGGDKPAEYLSIDAEENPFLGVRGARLYQHYPEVFETQVRALLRAAVHGDLWVMVPMVSTVAEIVDVRRWIDRIAADAGIDDRDDLAMPRFGAMVEVPALALNADAVVGHVDFLSIGSNDLTQYTLAADRTNEHLGNLQDAAHPSVLALCRQVATAARRAEVSSSVCGLSAADPACAAAYAAMGIDKLSVSASMVNPIKASLSGLDPAPGPRAVAEAITTPSAAEAREVIDRWRTG